jgi:hypothetical protein
MTPPTDDAVVDRWWRAFVAEGVLPPELAPVQTRLIRGVHRGALPSGPVHVKSMAFPRAKDRLRYAFRALPAAHEAAMLQRLAAAGLAVPEVVAVRTLRRALLPSRSLLVLRTLPAAAAEATPKAERLCEQAALAVRMLAAGVAHGDLHDGNFVRLADGRLAVLDLQSASLVGPRRAAARRTRVHLAAKLLQDRPAADAGAVVAGGLLRDDGERRAAVALAAAQAAAFARGRVDRCTAEATGFTRAWRWWGCEHRRRGEPADARWVAVGPPALAAWRGQRVRELAGARDLPFVGCRRRWPWLAGAQLLVRREVADADVTAAVARAVAAAAHFAATGQFVA